MDTLSTWLYSLYVRTRYVKPAFDQMTLGPSPSGENHLMVQFFEWKSLPPPGLSWWQHFESEVPRLASLGCSQVWLPPPNKAMVPHGRGYDAYDLWGTKEQFLSCIRTAKAHGIDILIDAVLNHKLGGDRREKVLAVEVDPNNRLKELGPPKEIEAWTAFDYKGRGDKYSSMKWNEQHFTGVDWDHKARKNGIYKFVGPGHQGWSKNVDSELGNYDYLLGIDIDFRHPDVQKDFFQWGPWVLKETGAAGFRLDACKHVDREFLRNFVLNARNEPGYESAFIVAELWVDSAPDIERYIKQINAPISMFDVPLHHNFYRASQAGPQYDLRTILQGALLERRPRDAVTFVDNHDTAVGCSLESWVGPEFKLIAYAVILLRPDGHPCVYHADLYGPLAIPQLTDLMTIRLKHAYGGTEDYFDDANCIAWIRQGNEAHPNGCVVLCANAEPKGAPFTKELLVGRNHVGSVWKNLLSTAWSEETVTIAESGEATFSCPRRGVAVWVRE